MMWPTLYKKTSTGAIQQWRIWTDDSTIHTEHGHVDGAMQVSTDLVSEGKNVGKKNETTARGQAEFEAKAKWEKQVKKGYVQDKHHAEEGGIDEAFIEGGVLPMLAHKFRDHAKKIIYPAAAQPKLDGIRCEGVVEDDDVGLWSRTRKPLTGTPHIEAAIRDAFAGSDIVTDGELYNHALRADFEQIISHVRKGAAGAGSEIIEYHLYDLAIEGLTFEERNARLKKFFDGRDRVGPLVYVETVIVNNEDELMAYFANCIERGYEGCMVRNLKGKYVGKRSYDLQKVKEFDDNEFAVAATMEGRGIMAGKAVFGCKLDQAPATVYDSKGEFDTDHPNQFAVKMKGSLDALRQYLNNPRVIGKMLTVQHFGYTKYNKPRFPVGKAVRDYE
jgi:DNA ligase-1